LARGGGYGVGDEVLGAESFLDMGEVVIGGLDEICTFASRLRGLGVPVLADPARGCGGRALAGGLDRVEPIVANTGGFVGERHCRVIGWRSVRGARPRLAESY